MTHHIDVGISVPGTSNRLIRNTVYAFDTGLTIAGAKNRVNRNTVSGYRGGIFVGGTQNRATRNDVFADKGTAISLFGQGHSLASNVAKRTNDGCAIRIGGEGHTVRRTDAIGEFPFCVYGHNNSLLENAAHYCGYDLRGTSAPTAQQPVHRRAVPSPRRVGFRISGTSHLLIENEAADHQRSGFHVLEGSVGHVLKGNTALGNATGDDFDDPFDLRDDNPDCGTNRWFANSYGTRSQSCIGGRAE